MELQPHDMRKDEAAVCLPFKHNSISVTVTVSMKVKHWLKFYQGTFLS
jgi:hypothetical protein